MSPEIFKAKLFEAETGQNTILLNQRDIESFGLHAGDRVEASMGDKNVVVVVDVTRTMVDEGEVGAFTEVTDRLSLSEEDKVKIAPVSHPESIGFIRKMMKGNALGSGEIHAIVKDIVEGRLTSSEITAFLVTQEIRNLSIQETADLTRSMVETGDTIELDEEPVLDVHSIGGIPGNKYSLLTVPIVASAGLTIPKTSSKAITSPAGTADIMGLLADVSLTLEEISNIVRKVGGVLAWGGAVNLAPADDILVRLERPLGIDPRSQLLASILSKKLSVNTDMILIDIPKGPGAKMETDEDSKNLAHDFISLGHELNVEVETVLTYGGQPLGYAVGPGLEAREALETLQGNGPNSLIEKSTGLAGILLEMGDSAPLGQGTKVAMDILKSGKAYNKMQGIIEAQGGDPDVKMDDLPIGDKKEVISASKEGYVKRIYNSRIRDIARTAGAPRDPGAGIKLFYKEGREIDKGDQILEIYAEHENKLEDAIKMAKKNKPFRIEGMMLERVSKRTRTDLS